MGAPHCIFLLGAGASAPAGLPTSFKMTDLFIDTVKSRQELDLENALCLVLGAMHLLKGQMGQFPDSNINVEEVAATLDALFNRRAHQLSPFVGSWHEMLGMYDGSRGTGRNHIQELGDILRSGVKEWLTTPPTGNIRYLECFRDIARTFEHIDVFTLNYDLCLETALKTAEVGFTCGFTSTGWNTDEFSKPDLKVRIYKLHGSLDWYTDVEDRTIYSTLCPPQDRVPAYDLNPLLIFGAGNKMKSVDPFLHLSYTFAERVKSANIVTVVGYAFGDDYVNDILLQGFHRDSRKRMVVVGRNKARAEEMYRKGLAEGATLIDAGRVRFVSEGADEALLRGTLLTAIQESAAEATDEGPFK